MFQFMMEFFQTIGILKKEPDTVDFYQQMFFLASYIDNILKCIFKENVGSRIGINKQNVGPKYNVVAIHVCGSKYEAIACTIAPKAS